MEVVGGRSQRLVAVLTDLGFTDDEWTTRGVGIAEEWEWQRDTNTKVGYRATTSVIVRIVDLERVERLVERAVTDVAAEIGNLRWFVSDGHPARRALLGAAAIDATNRADAYAEALGLQRGAVEEVSDLPLTASGAQAPNLFAMRSKSADAAVTMHVNPGEIDLEASVHVRFATLPH